MDAGRMKEGKCLDRALLWVFVGCFLSIERILCCCCYVCFLTFAVVSLSVSIALLFFFWVLSSPSPRLPFFLEWSTLVVFCACICVVIIVSFYHTPLPLLYRLHLDPHPPVLFFLS